jgi:GT2 family glycosyltransferase
MGSANTVEGNTHLGEGRTNAQQSGSLELTIIIVSYNTREMTLNCLRSIFAQTEKTQFEIRVVDNNSQDGSPDAIRTQFPSVGLIALDENIGFARANNLMAAKSTSQKLLLLNPDTVVLDHAIDRLMTFANENPLDKIWGGRTQFADGSLNPSSCWREMTLWSLACHALGLTYVARNSPFFNSEAYAGWDRTTVRHVDIVTGCLFLIDRELWTTLEGFNTAFFMYGEDADLCHRARRVGACPIITPDAIIVHYGSASESTTVGKRIRLFKGKSTLMRLHWSPLRRRLGRVLFLLTPLSHWLAYRIGAKLTNNINFGRKASEWYLVWQHRHDWIDGY